MKSANEISLPYTGAFQYGVNQGYYPGWSAQNTAKLAKSIGCSSIREQFYDGFLKQYGLTALVADMEYFKSIGIKEITAIIGAGDQFKDYNAHFPGMYEPIWLSAGVVNPANTYAKYLFDVVSTYGKYITFWEVINEPDNTWSEAGWSGDIEPPLGQSWFNHNPIGSEVYNTNLSIFGYNRILRISWEIIKTLSPNSYVCTGGIGYRAYLDAILRNTDNPVDGSVTVDYPLKAGAYFDVISFHTYPEYDLKYWDPVAGKVVWDRESDTCADWGFIRIKNRMDAVAIKYGYDGTVFPKKQFICTETNVARQQFGDNVGGVQVSQNYIMKAAILAQMNGIKQMYAYQLGDGPNPPTNEFDTMGLFTDLLTKKPTDVPTLSSQGQGYSLVANTLNGFSFDPLSTKALNLPSNLNGGVFKNAAGDTVYALWVKTTKDLSETVTAYSFTLPNAQSVILGAMPQFIIVKAVPVVTGPKTVLDVTVNGAHYLLKDDHTWS